MAAKRVLAAVLVAMWAGYAPGASTQVAAPAQRPVLTSQIVKLDPGLDGIVAQDATIEKVRTGFKERTEGPVWSRDGALIFSELLENTIYKMQPSGELSVLRKNSGWSGPLIDGVRVGSNGLTLDQQGRLIICEQGNRRVTRLEPDGTLTVLADKYEGKRLNRPNDVVVKSDGAIYFTDPDSALDQQKSIGCLDCDKELGFQAVFRILNGKLELLTKDVSPNGIAFSPDEKYLLLTNGRKWMRYEVKADGTLGAASLLYDVSGEKLPGGVDGMKVDMGGNLYGTGPGGVWIISPAGKALGRIQLPETPMNVAFGGNDGKTLYMTAQTSVYKIQLKATGKRPCC